MVVGRINGVVALTGFSYEEMYGRFAGTKKSGGNNEVVVRRGSTVLQSDIFRPTEWCKTWHCRDANQSIKDFI